MYVWRYDLNAHQYTFIIEPSGVEFRWRKNLNCRCWKTCFIHAKNNGRSHESGLEMRKPAPLQGNQLMFFESTCSRSLNIFQWTCFIIQMKTFEIIHILVALVCFSMK